MREKPPIVQVGQRFGRLEVVDKASAYIRPSDGEKRKRWLCRCDCGMEKVVHQDSLRRELTKSCGCLAKELTAAREEKHGHAKKGHVSTTFRSWSSMLQRCNDPNADQYQHYGGRGIVVCDRWRKFENFLSDMGERPLGLSLDRVDNDGNYEPTNCRWATQKEQCRNTRRTHFVTLQGRRMSLAEASELSGVPYHTARDRIARYGWSDERAFSL